MVRGSHSHTPTPPFSHTPILSLALLSDAHLEGAASAGPVRAATASLNADPPDFVVFGGDMVDLGTREQLALFQGCLLDLRVPYHVLPGNHDLGNAGQAGLWMDAFGPLNSAWESGGIHCIALDTTNTDPDPENWHGWVEAPAMEWLRATLAAIPPDAPHVLLTHHGLAGTPEDLSRDVANADDVLGLFRGRRLVAGFAGHSHRLLLNRWEGIPFFTTPSLSATRPPAGVPAGFLRGSICSGSARVCGWKSSCEPSPHLALPRRAGCRQFSASNASTALSGRSRPSRSRLAGGALLYPRANLRLTNRMPAAIIGLRSGSEW